MNSRTTWSLVLLAALLFAFIVLVERRLRPGGGAADRLLPNLKVSAVTSVQVRPADQLEIRVDRTNGTWQLTKPVTAIAQAANVENLLQTLDKLARPMRITAQELQSRPQADKEFGFESPQFSLIVQQGDYRYQILVGAKTALGDEVFLQVVGVEGIFVVDAGLLKLLPRNANEWRDLSLASLKDTAFDRLLVTNGAKVFELQRPPPRGSSGATVREQGGSEAGLAAPKRSEGGWRMVRPIEARADNPKIEELLRKLQALHINQFVTDDPKADLESFGLQPAELELSFAQGTNTVLGLQFGKSPTNDAGLVYARRLGQDGVVLVAKDQIATWHGQYEDFRDRHLVTLAAGSVDTVEIHGAENFILQRGTNDTWRISQPEGMPVDPALVNELIARLGSMEVAQFVKAVVTELDFPSYGLAPPARQYTLKGATSEAGSGATNGIIVQLDFGAAQDEKVFVRRSDENSVYAVKLADFQWLPDAGWQFRERRIWDFPESAVMRLTIRQQGKIRELVRSGTNHWAFAPGSQGVINDFAVEEAVHRLGDLTAVAWVARGDEALARYGLVPALYQLAIEVKDADKTRTFNLELGASPTSQTPVGAVTLDGQTWIFDFPAPVLEYVRQYLTIPTAVP